DVDDQEPMSTILIVQPPAFIELMQLCEGIFGGERRVNMDGELRLVLFAWISTQFKGHLGAIEQCAGFAREITEQWSQKERSTQECCHTLIIRNRKLRTNIVSRS